MTWRDLPAWILDEAGVVRQGRTAVEIPYRLPDGSEHARRIVHHGRRWWRPSGRGVIPFGLEQLWPARLRRYRALAICEGESDALALRAAHGDTLDVLGIPGASCWRPEFARFAEGYSGVCVIGDGDPAGQRFAWRVRHDLPGALVVELPAGEDVRSLLQGARPETLLESIARAEDLREFERFVLGKEAA